MSLPETMKAAVFRGPHNIVIEDKPVPQIQDPRDIIIKVKCTGLCGSELHTYRGNLATGVGHIMGHEFTGTVVAAGDAVETVKVGDEVVSCFTCQCGKCWFCSRGFSSQCKDALVFGTPKLDGGQAEYARVPLADGTVFKKPAEVDDSVLVLMADIFTTGYFGVSNYTNNASQEEINEAVAVLFGCGPVGLCAIASAKQLGIKTIYAVDSVPSRLEQAKQFGAIPLDFTKDDVEKIVKEGTGGRGADVVFEVVGSEDAIGMAFKVIRACGFISSIGYQHGALPFNGLDCYLKNAKLQFGRCPSWSLFPPALEVFTKVADQFKDFIDYRLPLTDAPKAYDMFDQHKARKIVFYPNGF